jgi:inosose dehydratase
MQHMKFGCQAYTWQMSFDRFAGQVAHIAETVKEAGFTGV